MTDEEYSRRRRKSFAEAEGALAQVTQLNKDEISEQLKSLVWREFHDAMKNDVEISQFAGGDRIKGRWFGILKSKFVEHDHRLVDEFNVKWKIVRVWVKEQLISDDYLEFYGLIGFVIAHRSVDKNFVRRIKWALSESKSPYRIFNDDTLVPIASDEEADNYARAVESAANALQSGAKSHLLDAGKKLADGLWSESIRESIHAVESVAKNLSPNTKTLGPALEKLQKNSHLHSALKEGFKSIYGFTSDEDGIRHSLLDDEKSNVDETDALFMLGACAAFVTYLINRGRDANVLNGHKT